MDSKSGNGGAAEEDEFSALPELVGGRKDCFGVRISDLAVVWRELL